LTITITIGGVHKGGVGKTTAAITVGHGLALAGYTVLIVDLDAQGHVAYYLGLERRPMIYRLLVDREPIKKCVLMARSPNLCIVPSDASTAMAQEKLVTMRFNELRLKQALAPLQGGPNLVILDTAPGAGALHDAAMGASDYVLAVVEASTASLDGLSLLTQTIGEFRGAGHPVGLLGIIPMMLDDRTLASQDAMEALHHAQDGLAPVYPGVHRATIFQRSVSDGRTIWEVDPTSRTRATAEYSAVIRRLLEDLDP